MFNIVPDSYKHVISKYSRLDAFFAFLLFILYTAALFCTGFIFNYVSKLQITFFGMFINLLFSGIVILFVLIRKQGLDTLGITKGNLKLSLLLGSILALILFFCNCLSNIIFEGQTFIAARSIILNIFYYFTVALCEEILFRGYIQTRLHGITHNICIDIFVSGLMFVFMHYPFRMIAYNLSFKDFVTNLPFLLDLFITHLILSFIRIKSNNIYGSIIPHWISDLSYSIVTHL